MPNPVAFAAIIGNGILTSVRMANGAGSARAGARRPSV